MTLGEAFLSADSRKKHPFRGGFCLRWPDVVGTVEWLSIDHFPGIIRDSRESEAKAGS